MFWKVANEIILRYGRESGRVLNIL